MRLESLQEKIAWDLEKYIGDEKQGQSDVNLTAFQLKFRRQSQRQSVADVYDWEADRLSA